MDITDIIGLGLISGRLRLEIYSHTLVGVFGSDIL